MTVTRYELVQVHDELNKLRLVIKELISVTTNLMDRIEKLEKDNYHLRQGHLPE